MRPRPCFFPWRHLQYSRYLKAPIPNPSQPHPISSLIRASMQPAGQGRVTIYPGAHQNNLFFLTKPQWCVGRARYFPSTEGSLSWKVVGLDLFVQGSLKYLERIPRRDAKAPDIWSGVQHGLLLKFVLFCSWAACAASLMAALLCAPCMGLSPRFSPQAQFSYLIKLSRATRNALCGLRYHPLAGWCDTGHVRHLYPSGPAAGGWARCFTKQDA